VGGNIDAYDTQPPFKRQRVVAAGTAPDGSEPHGQICFLPDGSRRFVVAESRPAGPATPASAGWGLYQLTGDGVGSFRVVRLGGVTSPSAPGAAPSTYGCAFLPDGRLLTTDAGAPTGAATGQLTIWFPPFTNPGVAHCTVAGNLSSPAGLAADQQGAVYLAATRAPGAGVWRYKGTFPRSAGSCAAPTPTTAAPPSAGSGGAETAGVTATLLVAAGPNGVGSPSALALGADGKTILVSSPPDGVIARYDLNGVFVAAVVSPPAGEVPGAAPRANGSPFGLAVNGDGAIFYADPGLLRGANGAVAPGIRLGTLRRVTVTGTTPAPPQLVNEHLDAPDGLGLFDPSAASGGSASIA
jgi:hypothetical protein